MVAGDDRLSRFEPRKDLADQAKGYAKDYAKKHKADSAMAILAAIALGFGLLSWLAGSFGAQTKREREEFQQRLENMQGQGEQPGQPAP